MHKERLADRDRQIEEKSRENASLRELAQEQSQQITMLVEKVQLSVHMAEALKSLGEEA